MNLRDKELTVGKVVTLLPESKGIFKKVGIDFCCGGHKPLIIAIEEGNLDADFIYSQLETVYQVKSEEARSVINNVAEEDPNGLTVLIEHKHHGYLREVLPLGLELLSTLVRVHGSQHRELFQIYQLFGRLKTDLEQHLLKEEMFLFPELVKGDDQNRIIELSHEIIDEHEEAGEILKSLREITNDYTVPSDGCETYHKAFSLLEDIETDLHDHIHLENNILLKEYDHRRVKI